MVYHNYFLLFLLFCSSSAFGQQSRPNTSPFIVKGNVSISAPDSVLAKRLGRAWKYSFGQEPAARLLSRGSNSMTTMAHFNYRSGLLTGRQETIGVISYQLELKIVGSTCYYTINSFVHRGNTSTRIGGIHFGRLMQGQIPQGKVRGLSKKTIMAIHTDMKIQLEERIATVLKLLKLQLSIG